MTEPIFDELRDTTVLPAWAHHISTQLAHLTKEIKAMSADQDKLDSDVQALTSGLDAVEAEIAALKNQPAAAALDFTALDEVVSRLQGEVPAPDPSNPTPAAA